MTEASDRASDGCRKGSERDLRAPPCSSGLSFQPQGKRSPGYLKVGGASSYSAVSQEGSWGLAVFLASFFPKSSSDSLLHVFLHFFHNRHGCRAPHRAPSNPAWLAHHQRREAPSPVSSSRFWKGAAASTQGPSGSSAPDRGGLAPLTCVWDRGSNGFQDIPCVQSLRLQALGANQPRRLGCAGACVRGCGEVRSNGPDVHRG